MSAVDLVALVCCDLGGIVRGRSLPATELGGSVEAGVGWTPANHSLTPLGTLAGESPFGSTGDLRLLPDIDTRARVEGDSGGEESSGGEALELLLCDIVETDGKAWECCPRHFLRTALEELESELGLRLVASFEHEFQLLGDSPAALPFSLEAQRRVGRFASETMGALIEAGVQPERFFAEYAAHQFEIPVQPQEGVAAADRAVVLREVVREVARRNELRASFTPLLNPGEAGNGAHVHLSLLDKDGTAVLYDEARPARLSELGGRFAAGILSHAGALSALTAPSPLSATRLEPHSWSAGAVCLGQGNREALVRIPPIVALGGGDPQGQLRLEYRGADAAANPYIALGAIVRAGVDGVRRELATPEILERDPGELDGDEAKRFGVGALPSTLGDALAALAGDEVSRNWMPPRMYEAYVGVKRAEVEAASESDMGELCRRYAAIY